MRTGDLPDRPPFPSREPDATALENPQVIAALSHMARCNGPLTLIRHELDMAAIRAIVAAVELLDVFYPMSYDGRDIDTDEAQLANLHYWLHRQAVAQARKLLKTWPKIDAQLDDRQAVQMVRALHAQWLLNRNPGSEHQPDENVLPLLRRIVEGTAAEFVDIPLPPDIAPQGRSGHNGPWKDHPWFAVILACANQLRTRPE